MGLLARPLDIDRIAMPGAQMAIVSLVSAAPSVAELGRAAASLARAD
jgi:hypothetical protein